MLQCVGASHNKETVQDHLCCSVLQCAAVCCSVWQCAAVCGSVWQCDGARHSKDTVQDHLCCSVLQRVAVCCSMLQRVAKALIQTKLTNLLGTKMSAADLIVLDFISLSCSCRVATRSSQLD